MSRETLWKNRFNNYLKETTKYLRFIFNGHLVFVMIILLGGAGYYYSEWLKTLTPDFPTVWIMAVLLGFITTISPVTTFFRDPDIVFLLPIESKLTSYIKKSIIFSLVMQGYILILILAILMPLYMQTMQGQTVSFLWLLLCLMVVKAINICSRWFVLYYREKSTAIIDGLVRFLLNTAFVYFLVKNESILFIAIILLLIGGLCLYYWKSTRDDSLYWEKLIELENGRMAAFYRIANLFTDVPKLREKISERRWLNGVIGLLSGKSNNPFSYLYARTFVRANDYLGLFVRLTVIAAILFLFADLGWGILFVAILFLYMTGLQLLPIWHHHEQKMVMDLYPLHTDYRRKAVLNLLITILVIQTLIFFITVLIGAGVKLAIATLVSGIVFIFIFRPFAMKKM